MKNLELRDKQLLEEAMKNNIKGFYENLEKAFDRRSEEYDENYYICDDILDIKIISDFNKNIFGAIYAIALGGPNIYINTYDRVVRGCWGSTEIIESLDNYLYSLDLDSDFFDYLDGYIEELFENM